jgi:hypothetical protein
MHRSRIRLSAIRAATLLLIAAFPAVPSNATTGIVLRSRSRIVLAADSRVVYRGKGSASECKLFEVRDVYATVSGLAGYGKSYRVSDTIRAGFAGDRSFENHVASTAYVLRRTLERLLTGLQASNPTEYRYLMQRSNYSSDLVELAVAQTVNGQPMLGIIELRRTGVGNNLAATTSVCPGNCRQNTEIFYLGYWERIKPYVATSSGSPRNVASAASIDRLIRMEIGAHPNEVGPPINVLEVNGYGARWLQNGGNCSLPGVGW